MKKILTLLSDFHIYFLAFWLFTFYFFYVARFIVKRLQDIVARKHGRDWRRAGALTREKERNKEREREKESFKRRLFSCILIWKPSTYLPLTKHQIETQRVETIFQVSRKSYRLELPSCKLCVTLLKFYMGVELCYLLIKWPFVLNS